MAFTREGAAAIPGEDNRQAYRQLEHLLRQPAPRLVGADGQTAELPQPMARMMSKLAQLLASDRVAILTATNKDLTTQQAADLLGISRPTLVRLIEEEQAIPFVRIGKHRRLRFADVLAYREKLYQQRRQDMAEITRLGEEMGGYDFPVEDPTIVASSAS